MFGPEKNGKVGDVHELQEKRPPVLIEDESKEWPMGPLLEFPLHWMFAYTFSLPVVGFLGSIALAFSFDYSLLQKRQLLDGWCDITQPASGSFLSLSNAMELSLSANIMWRFCITLTAMPRIAIALCYRSLFTNSLDQDMEYGRVYMAIAALLPFVHTLEVLALSTMSIVSAGDSYELHVLALWVFIIGALVYMLGTIGLFVMSSAKTQLPDGGKSLRVKSISTGLYIMSLYVFIKGQYRFWDEAPCSPYVSLLVAGTEYILMCSYFVYHASAYWDIFKDSEVVIEAIQEVKDRFRLHQEAQKAKENSA